MNETAKRPPIGLVPRAIHNRNIQNNRFNEVCGAIARYYSEGLKIPIEWIEEYNHLIESHCLDVKEQFDLYEVIDRAEKLAVTISKNCKVNDFEKLSWWEELCGLIKLIKKIAT